MAQRGIEANHVPVPVDRGGPASRQWAEIYLADAGSGGHARGYVHLHLRVVTHLRETRRDVGNLPPIEDDLAP